MSYLTRRLVLDFLCLEVRKHSHCPEGFSIRKGEFGSLVNDDVYFVHPDLAFSQNHPISSTDLWAIEGGSVSVFGLYGEETGHAIGGVNDLVDTAFWHVAQHNSPARYAAQMKFSPLSTGGTLFYLAGHDYGTDHWGVRMYLNAVLMPTSRPSACGFDIVDAVSQPSPTDETSGICGCGLVRDQCNVCDGNNDCVPQCIPLENFAEANATNVGNEIGPRTYATINFTISNVSITVAAHLTL